MRFKWDSDVARDIVDELNRLEEELTGCAAEIEHGTEILLQMQKDTQDKLITKYVGVARKLQKSMQALEERLGDTGNGINHATEMFDEIESRMRKRAEGIEAAPQPQTKHGFDRQTPYLFNNAPNPADSGYTGQQAGVWPALPKIRQTVVIDQSALNSGMVTPAWLSNIINTN